MGTLLASVLIAQASEIVTDESNVVWTELQALAWLNDAQRAVAIVRPDSSVINRSVALIPGTKQSITGGSLRLMACVRNMGNDGATPGRAIRLVERGIKDEFEPDWHTEATSTVVKEYIFDARIPKEYYVSPPVPASPAVGIEVVEAISPAAVATTADPITLDDIYSPPMIEWIVYRFLSRDAEEIPNIQRPIAHFQAFFNLLGEKTKVDMAINPKIRAHLE